MIWASRCRSCAGWCEPVDLSFEREHVAATLQNVRDTHQQLVDNRDGLEADGRLHTAEENFQSLTDDLRVAKPVPAKSQTAPTASTSSTGP